MKGGIQLLPYDGETWFIKDFFTPTEASAYFDEILNTAAWQNDEVIMFGKHLTMSRKTAWYGTEPFSYTYSKIPRVALPFTPALNNLQALVSKHTQCQFNSALLNLYHHGMEGMGKHSDDEDSIVPQSGIASLSFGAERTFAMQHKTTKEKVRISLPSGSLLLMVGKCQECWWHELPKTKNVSIPRINITFRLMK